MNNGYSAFFKTLNISKTSGEIFTSYEVYYLKIVFLKSHCSITVFQISVALTANMPWLWLIDRWQNCFWYITIPIIFLMFIQLKCVNRDLKISMRTMIFSKDCLQVVNHILWKSNHERIFGFCVLSHVLYVHTFKRQYWLQKFRCVIARFEP